MAQTITTINSAVSLPTNTSVLVGSPVKTTLQAATLYVDLVVSIAQGGESSPSNLSSSVARQWVKLWFSVVPFASLTVNSTLPQQLMQAADFIECRVPTNGTSVTKLSSRGEIPGWPHGSITSCLWNCGGTLYTWYESPPQAVLTGVAPTFTLTSVEF